MMIRITNCNRDRHKEKINREAMKTNSPTAPLCLRVTFLSYMKTYKLDKLMLDLLNLISKFTHKL